MTRLATVHFVVSLCTSHATCEESRPKQGEGKDQASDTYK